MKHPIVALALAGTTRHEQVRLATDTPLDSLLAGLPEGETERALLLSAGALAIYRQAGMLAQTVEAHPPAAPETLNECSPEAALLLSRLLNGEQPALLLEALARMRRQGLRLPFHLLPVALNTTGKEKRAALFPLLGERGRWLSQFNSSWKWVNNFLVAAEEGLPADAETTWQEGTSGQRIELLRRLRAVDPAQALAWLEGVWKQEKAEVRGEMIGTLEIGLSAHDEAFLEKALDDRAQSVRATAAGLLAHLSGSALSQRMREHGQKLLRRVDGQIEVHVPAEFLPEWQRDGIISQPPGRVSQRGWWLTQILAALEPTFWETHLGASPAELLQLISLDHKWKAHVTEGWTRAVFQFRTPNWLVPLWSWWFEHYEEMASQYALSASHYRDALLQLIPGPTAERLIMELVAGKDGASSGDWWGLLPALPRPWNVEFAQFYLQILRERCAPEKFLAESFDPYSDPLMREITEAALCLPEACLAEALRPWDFPEDTRWQVEYAIGQLKEFIEIVHMRQKITEEIH